MKFLKKLKSSNFWVSMISAVVLILQAVFNVDIKTEYLSQIIMAMLGLLVMSGIVTDNSGDEVTVKQDTTASAIKDGLAEVINTLTSAFSVGMGDIVKQLEVIDKAMAKTDKTYYQNEQDGIKPIEDEQSANVTESKEVVEINPVSIVEENKAEVRQIIDLDNTL